MDDSIISSRIPLIDSVSSNRRTVRCSKTAMMLATMVLIAVILIPRKAITISVGDTDLAARIVDKVATMEYDYVIVGAGSAGSLIAERLSRQPDLSIALIEIGTYKPSTLADGMPGVRQIIQTRCNSTQECGLDNSAYNFVHTEGFQVYSQSRFQVRHAWGGTSSLSVGAHFSGGDDYWAKLSRDFGHHWSLSKEMLRSLQLELGLSEPPKPRDPILPLVFDAFKGVADQPYSSGLLELPQYRNETSGLYLNSYSAYLEKAAYRSNLHILSPMKAERVVVEEGRATGIIVRSLDQDAHQNFIRARREVVLASGALGSAALLKRSSPYLSSLVQPLRDQPIVTLSWHCGVCNISTAVIEEARRAMEAGLPHEDATRKGAMFDYNVMYRQGTFLDLPLMPVLVVPRIVTCWACEGTTLHGDQLEMDIFLQNPKDYEFTVWADDTISQQRHLTHKDDVATAIEAVKIVKDAVESSTAFRNLQLTPVGRFHNLTKHEFQEANVYSAFAATGTCRLGAVVDGKLRVNGVKSLRIADASVLPEPPRGRPFFSVIRVAQVAVELLEADQSHLASM